MVDETITLAGRVCTKCGEWKPLAAFYQSRRDGVLARCRKCQYKYCQEWREKNPEKAKASRERRKLRHGPLPIKPLRTTADGKLCSICGERKPPRQFTTDRNNPDGRSNRCRDCARTHHRSWRAINASELKKKHSRLYRYKTWGIGPEEFMAMLVAQDYKCPVCAEELSLDAGRGKNACIDHDHVSGQIRGILCSSCNRAIGLLKESILILGNAVEYMRKAHAIT